MRLPSGSTRKSRRPPDINIPVIVINGLILEHPQHVGGLPRLHQLPVVLLVEQGGEMPVVIESHPVEGRLDMPLIRPGKGGIQDQPDYR